MTLTAHSSDLGTVTALGARAAARREELGLTQSQVAQRIGKSREWVLRFERGNPGANLEGVLSVLHELNITLTEQPLRKGVPTMRRITATPVSSPVAPVQETPSFVVPNSLAELRGPATGEIDLPKRILWNPSRPFNLSNDKRAVTLLRTVLQEARKPEDLQAYVNPTLLTRLWGKLRLPVYIRDSWEKRFPELANA